MRTRIHKYWREGAALAVLQLVRLPGVFTAFGNVLAGYLLVRFFGAGAGNVAALPFLLGASACFFMAGMAWNDIFDCEEDRRQRPNRPLPSGRISLTAAFMLATLLSCAGLLLTMRAGFTSFLCGSALLVMILLYNAGGKKIEGFGPLTMGGCRGLNLLLGMTAHPFILIFLENNPLLWVPPLLLTAYTIVITILALMETSPQAEPAQTRTERWASDSFVDSDIDTQPLSEIIPDSAITSTKTEKKEEGLEEGLGDTPRQTIPATAAHLFNNQNWVLIFGTVAMLLVPLGAIWILPYRPVALFFFLLLFLTLATKLYRAFLDTSTQARQRLIGGAIAGMVFLDSGCVASMSSGFYPSLEEIAGIVLVAAMFIPAWVLKRRIAVT